MGGLGLTLAACLAVLAAASAYGDYSPDLYVGEADYPRTDTATNGVCTVTISHERLWDMEYDPPRNNHPHEKSLYPGDVVDGRFTRTAEGCCGVSRSGPTAAGEWSELANISSGGSYTQTMKILPDRPTPDSVTRGGHIHTSEYDTMGRSRTHWQGTAEGYGQTAGATASISGGRADPITGNCIDRVTASITTKFTYRNPFWETSIFEHHVLDARGYPASNLDYSQYPYDSIPLEAGSNLVLGAYRHETIQISHELLSGGAPVAEFHCDSKTCNIDLPGAPESESYVGHMPYQGDSRNPPWRGPDPGTGGMLDRGEAMFAIPARSSGPIRILSTMWNDGIEVARGYNTTHQFVPSYNPLIGMTAITNTALGGDSALERPVSVIIQYDGTISDTLHYCSVGTIYDTDGTMIPYGSTGGMDAWGRKAGDACPEHAAQWGDPGACGSPGCSYVAHPDPPLAPGWGRWSAANPETRAMFYGFGGGHAICAGDECATHDTPYMNWDFVPGTDRDFIPACIMDGIAAAGGDRTNQPKPENWGLDGEWWPDGPHNIGEGAEPHSYRGVFAGKPNRAPTHYVVDTAACEAKLGARECVPRGAECRPEYDRRCEDTFTPYLYPDDYILAGHGRLQDMVVEWCGDSPTDRCAAEAYHTIDDVMVATCSIHHGVDYMSHNQVIDVGPLEAGADLSTPNVCHNMYANGLRAPGMDGEAVSDWRACYGMIPEGDGVWPDGRPDADPGELCAPVWGGGSLSLPYWNGATQNVYVPYTPTTGAFAGVVERPGNMMMDDGSLTCSCDDMNGNGICDYSEATDGRNDLNRNGIIDDWDAPTLDGSIKCLDRTGTAAAAVVYCWAKYGSGAAGGESDRLTACMEAARGVADGPDGECDPAVILGMILPDGSVSTDGLSAGWEAATTGQSAHLLAVPFLGTDGLIPIPYVVDGIHVHCDESEPWCVSSGDTYLKHAKRDVCEDPGLPVSVKRIPSPATIPPLYRPVFDEAWPPPCLPEYPVGEWNRPEHEISLDLAGLEAEWPTIPPQLPGMGAGRTPSHISTGDGHTMIIHAGTGVLRFESCDGCEPPLSGDGEWTGMVRSGLGGREHVTHIMMQHPPYALSQEGMARVVAVEPCAECEAGWREAGAGTEPGIGIVITAYPETDTPATKPGEMAAVGCQIDGDGGTGILNMWDMLVSGPAIPTDYWNGMTCRDIPGLSITIQDYEAARHGIAAKREAGQPWTVAEGTNDVTVEVLRNGVWLSTLSMLEHRGQCTTYAWSQGVTPGHTSCPATAHALSECLYEGGDVGACLDMAGGEGACAAVYVEDNIHKKWEFAEGGDVPAVYRLPDGSYAGMADDTIIPMDAERLAWEPGGGEALLRCEVAVDSNGTIHGVERGLPAGDVDFNRGGSFACQEVQACQKTRTTYKCLGGEVIPHVTCEEPAESFSALDMPYEEVMSNVGTQKLHIEAVCPPEHAHAGDSTRCDGLPIYDTHALGGGSNHTTIYVDYFGVGELGAGRGDPSSYAIHLRPPETFGTVHDITVEWEGGHVRMTPGTPCTTCTIEYPGGAAVTVHNRYGAALTTVVAAAEPPRPSIIEADEIYGAAWLYLPALAAGAAIYAVIRKYQGLSGRG